MSAPCKLDSNDYSQPQVRAPDSFSLPSSGASTDWLSSHTSSSDCGGASASRGPQAWPSRCKHIDWEDVKFGSQIQPYRAHAHRADDIYLLSRFLELAKWREDYGGSIKLLLRSIKLLRLCDYSVEEICSTLSHASSYFRDAYAAVGSQMNSREVGNVLVVLIFVAHCYVQDECCPLKVWHQRLFRKYCPMKTLNEAVMELMQIRNYSLRIEDDDLDKQYKHLIESQRHRMPAFLR